MVFAQLEKSAHLSLCTRPLRKPAEATGALGNVGDKGRPWHTHPAPASEKRSPLSTEILGQRQATEQGTMSPIFPVQILAGASPPGDLRADTSG